MKQNILITGVGQRIGHFLASELSGDGYQVIGTYRSDRPALRKLKAKGVHLIQADFYQPNDIQRLINKVSTDYTSLRAIIHNASDWISDRGNAAAEVIEKMMRVHVYAPYQINLALAPLLKNCSEDFSDIIHFSDYVASVGSKKHLAYAASKAALSNLTLSFASLMAPKVKVNAIAPGLILFNEQDDLPYRQKALKKSLIQTEGGVEEIAHAVRYLLGSAFVTGRVLPVDGGRHLVRVGEQVSNGFEPNETLLFDQKAS